MLSGKVHTRYEFGATIWDDEEDEAEQVIALLSLRP
jgi:hypothetical protein